jgi:outer membrane lipoprotein SlyB|tara:strand:+ start:130 stop:249 length:120 start_codon:yes stop_codon:yes gene_type:complete
MDLKKKISGAPLSPIPINIMGQGSSKNLNAILGVIAGGS